MNLRAFLGLGRRHHGQRHAPSLAEDRRRRRARASRPVIESMESRELLTIAFQFDYSLDSKGFFSSSDRRAALEYAGHLLGDRLGDSLSAIVPSGGNTWSANVTNPATGGSTTFKNPSLPSNTIRVYAGGRDLAGSTLGIGGGGGYSSFGSTSWNTLVKTRGQTGVSTGSDISPRIGSITFDTVGTNWFFGRTSSGRSSGQSDFLSVAQHELGHILGFSNGNPSWTRFISGGTFNGSAVKAANNNRTVAVSSDRSHFGDGVKSGGIEAAMDPSLTRGTRKNFGRLDFAALSDMGWVVTTGNESIYQAADQLIYIPDPVLGTSAAVTFNNGIGTAKDVDFYRVYIGAGSKLSASVRAKTGGVRVDTYLKLYDTVGNLLTTADQGGTGEIDRITNYSITRSDYYIVAVSSFMNRSYNPFIADSGAGGPMGDYTLTLSAF